MTDVGWTIGTPAEISAPGSGSSTLAVPMNGSVGDEDLLIVATTGAAAQFHVTGWADGPTKRTDTSPSLASRLSAFTRVVDGTEGSTISAVATSPTDMAGIIISFSNTDAITPIDYAQATPDTQSDQTQTSLSSTGTAGPWVTGVADVLAVHLLTTNAHGTAGQSAAHSSFTKIVDYVGTNNVHLAVALADIATAGTAIGTETWTYTKAGRAVAALMGFRAAVAAPPPPGGRHSIWGWTNA